MEELISLCWVALICIATILIYYFVEKDLVKGGKKK